MSVFAFLHREPVPVTILAGPFRGARLILNPACSKRKLVGAYEHVLNSWLEAALRRVSVIWDVGANDGYFTYGCAAAIQRHGKTARVVAFEPGLDDQPNLQIPSGWKCYRNARFEFVPKFVGAADDRNTITLARAHAERPAMHDSPGLVKVDVEGAETEVLAGARPLLDAPHHWVVEVHGDHLLAPTLKFFADAGRAVDVHEMKPHWLFGPEQRSIKTSWITTRL
jgi:hypothetical protein